MDHSNGLHQTLWTAVQLDGSVWTGLFVKRTHIGVLLNYTVSRDHQNIISTNADEESTALAITENDSENTVIIHTSRRHSKGIPNWQFYVFPSSFLLTVYVAFFSLSCFRPVILILFLHCILLYSACIFVSSSVFLCIFAKKPKGQNAA